MKRTETPAAGRQEAAGPWVLTGNHYLAFPCVHPETGAIHRANVLHRGLMGLVEWAADPEPDPSGEALLAPEFAVDGRRVVPEPFTCENLDRWIPVFRGALTPELRVTGTLCTPGYPDLSIRGGCYLFEFENRGRAEATVEVSLRGLWRWTLRTIVDPQPLPGENRVGLSRLFPGLALEAAAGDASAAFAVVAGSADARYEAGPEGPDGGWADLSRGGSRAAPNGAPHRFRVAQTVRVPAGGRAAAAFYFGVGPEREGALAAAAHLLRLGADRLRRETRLDLARLARRTADPSVGALANRNLVFNLFYGVGRAIDDDRLYPIASRSPLCRPAAVFNEREALLWSYPALLLADTGLAREVLLRAYEQYSHRPGERLHYLDGGILAPGFALDHLCAYILALDLYVRTAQDESILDEPIVQDVLRELDANVFGRLHPEVYLCSTELLPSGEPAAHRYVTYSNVLLWAASAALETLWIARDEQDRPRLAGAAEEIAAAIWRKCTAEVNGLRVLACSTDLDGEAAVYDDPAGSLLLLPHTGFCDVDDPIWSNTIEWLLSPANPLWLGREPYPGLAGRERPRHPLLAGLAAMLLGPQRDQALEVLRRLELEGDVASETYDAKTGRSHDRPYHAPTAGFLAWALFEAFES